MQRLFIIYNPRSSNFCHVEKDVLSRLPGLNGFIIGKYQIKKTNFDDNVSTLSTLLKDDDIVVSAGGDATAAISLNAIIKSRKNATLAVLPYGNFNDFARTLKTKTLDDILANYRKTTSYYPLEVLIDGKLWRCSSCYVTIGMTAEAVKIFNNKDIRHNLQKGCHNSWRSYLNLAKWYFKNRHKKNFIPECIINHQPIPLKTSDYFAINGSSIAGIMKSGEDYKKPRTFTSCTVRLTSFCRLVIFMMKSILKRTPSTPTSSDVLEFATPTTITIQAEGEPSILKSAHKIEITKSPDLIVKVITK